MVKISVIIPVLNKGHYIGRSLNSVIQQTYEDFEVIVVDGGSTDGTLNVIDSFEDPRIRLVSQPTKGVSEARNHGVWISRGHLIAFLDADDEWLPWHLMMLLKLRRGFPESGMYAMSYQIQEKNGTFRRANLFGVPEEEGLIPDYFKSATLGEFPVWTGAVGIPREIFGEMGGFPEGYHWGEDADLFARIALKHPIAFSSAVSAVYHWDSTGRACSQPNLEKEPLVLTASKIPIKTYYFAEYVNKKELYRAACWIYKGFVARPILDSVETELFWKEKIVLQVLDAFPFPLVVKMAIKLKYGFE